MVNNNTNTASLLPPYTSLLELCVRKSTAFADFAVVSHGLCTDSGAKEGEGAHAEGGSFCFPGGASTEFASRLVKPSADMALPVLAEVIGMEDCTRANVLEKSV